MAAKVKINRAPVLTLWASVVAEQLGYDTDTALTLGKVLAGLNAQSKGQSLGIYEPSEGTAANEGIDEKRADKTMSKSVRLLGRQIAMQETDQGLRAEDQGKAVDPKAVERYLEQKFKDHLSDVRQAMQVLAQSIDHDVLEQRAYAFYEEFRPDIPEGKRGWGAAGDLDLDKIQRMAEKQ